MKKERTRVTVDFPTEEHRRLKAVAALMGISMQEYIIGCIEEKLYSTNIPNIPNVRTKKAIEDLEKGKGTKIANDIDDLKRQLGL